MSFNVIGNWGQLVAVPVIAGMVTITLTIVVALQLVGNVYVIVVVATETPWPVTTPEEDPTDAIAALLLLHVPLRSASDKVIDAPEQTSVPPVIADGNGLIVIVAVVIQPVASV